MSETRYTNTELRERARDMALAFVIGLLLGGFLVAVIQGVF